MTKAELYVTYKRQGMGTREAARLAGFKQGVPSPQARQLLERVEMVISTPHMHAAALEQVEDARRRLAQGKQWLQACRLAGVVKAG